MNYDAELTRIITAIKADKSIVQPWRNKAISRLDETQAFVSMGKKMTNLEPPAGYQQPASASNPSQDIACICPVGAWDTSCPVHRG